MDLILSRLGIDGSPDPETAVIVTIGVLGLVCLMPLLAILGGRRADEDDSGHPLRSRLHTGNWD